MTTRKPVNQQPNSPPSTEMSEHNNAIYSSGTPSQYGGSTQRMSFPEQELAQQAARYGWGPLASSSLNHNSPTHTSPAQNPASLGPGIDKARFADTKPLAMAAFAILLFLWSLINLGTRSLRVPSIIVGPALAYGGLVMFAAGMWEIAAGDTFSALAITSYSGFWLALGIIYTPGGFQIRNEYVSGGDPDGYDQSISLFLFGMTVFTFFLLTLTLKTNVATLVFYILLDLTFLFLACAYQNVHQGGGYPQKGLLRAGGAFGILAAFTAWYHVLAAVATTSNSFIQYPVVHLPWSERANEAKQNRAEHHPEK